MPRYRLHLMIVLYICLAMSAWVFIVWLFLYCIGFSSADGISTDGAFMDGVSADGMLSFNDDMDPLQGTSTGLLDPTNANLISNVNFNEDENSDVLDMFLPNDSDSTLDLFTSDADSNPTVDSTILIADCALTNDGVLRKKAKAKAKAKARVRRDTACRNPSSESSPDLNLPTLDQARKDPLRPKTDREKVIGDALNNFLFRTGLFLKGANFILKLCYPGETKVCSSGDELDIQREKSGELYTLTSGTAGKSLSSPFPPGTNAFFLSSSLSFFIICTST